MASSGSIPRAFSYPVVRPERIVAADEFEAARFLEAAIGRQAHAFLLAREECKKSADIEKRAAASGTFAAGTDRTFAGCHDRMVDRQVAKNMARRCKEF